MFQGYKRRNRPKIEKVLVDIIINGDKLPAPPELIEHYYKKEYGLTTEQFYNEPADRIGWFLKIKELEGIREERESRGK
jgi:hypothetical protein